MDTLSHRTRRSRAIAVVAVTPVAAGGVAPRPGAEPLPPGFVVSALALAGGVNWAAYAGGRRRPGRRSAVAAGVFFAAALAAEPAGAARARGA